MIITIAGKAGENLQKSSYMCDILGINSAEYLNSIDVLTYMDEKELHILGTDEAINLQKRLLKERLILDTLNVNYHTFDFQKSDDVFMLISKIIEGRSKEEKIIIDITHGYRDHSMIAAYAAMVMAFMNEYNIKLVYAKQAGKGTYEFVELNEYMDLTEYTFYLRLFHDTSSIGHYRGTDVLLNAMYQFGEDFLSNNINNLVKNSYPLLKSKLKRAKELDHFAPLVSIIEKIENRLKFMETYDYLKEYEQYIELAKFSESMNYSIIALTYLHESISWYLYDALGEKLLSQKQLSGSYYQKTSNMRKIVNDEKNKKIFTHPFFQTMEEIKEMRNNLAHLSMEYQKGHVRLLNLYINKIEDHYKEDVLSKIKIPIELQRNNVKFDEIKAELEEYLKPIYKQQDIHLKNLIPKLHSREIYPSPCIPRNTVESLKLLRTRSDFEKKVQEYMMIVNG